MFKKSYFRSKLKCIATSLIVMLVLATLRVIPARAASMYYVNNTNSACSDSGSGTISAPFCTIGQAAGVAVAGETVRVLAGSYAETIKPNLTGAAGMPITFSAAPGVTVTGIPGNSTTGGAFRITLKSYIVVDGFSITGTADSGIVVDSSDHITISNNHVSYSGTTAIPKPGIDLSTATASSIIGNKTDHNTNDGIRFRNSSDGNWIEHNVSFGNAMQLTRGATGINFLASSSNWVIRNITYANEDTGLNFYAGSSFNKVINNLSYGNGDHGIDNNGSPSNEFISNTLHGNVTVGINFEQDTPFTQGSGNATLYNNIFVENGYRRQVGGGTFSESNPGNIRFDDQSITGNKLDYDLIFSSTPGTQIIWGADNYTNMNDFKLAKGQENHGKDIDPLFIAAATIAERPVSPSYAVAIRIGNYHLKAGSPAIDSAYSDAPDEQTTDIEGGPRVDIKAVPNTGAGKRAYDDRGAYEYRILFPTYLPCIHR